MSTNSQTTSIAFEFKSGVITVPVLNLFSTDINVINHQLREKINQAPEFFKNSSLLIDLQALDEQALNLSALTDAIRNAGMLPIGIRGGTQAQQQAAKEIMLPVMSAQSKTTPVQQVVASPETPPPAPQKTPEPGTPPAAVESILINQPIRSGQRIYAQGDLIITAQVSAGAEIIAEGNIHVYGALRGRALAGVQGNEAACIFCSDLQAELVSIAGTYRISEDIEDSERNTPVQIHLNKQALVIKKI